MNILLVGLGGMGTCHYMNYQHIEGAKVAACVGSTASDRERAAQWGLPIYESIADACKAHDVDVIDVCTPTHLHKPLVLEAAGCKKHVICEKPIALKLDDAKAMYAACEENGVQLYIAQVLQFTREVETLREVVTAQRYGKPLDGCFERLTAAPKWSAGGWLFDKEKSGLLPFDLHIHDLDVIVSLFGKPQSFSVNSCKGRDKTYAEHLRIDYNYGDKHVNGEAAWFNADSPWTARWRVYFENALVINDGTTMTAYSFDAPPRVFDTKDEVEISTGINVPPCGWYYNELKHFADCIREGKPTPYVTREQLLTVMEIIEEVSQWT